MTKAIHEREHKLRIKVSESVRISTENFKLNANIPQEGRKNHMQRTETHYVNKPCTPYFPTGLVKTESGFVRSFENDLGR